MSCVRTRDPLFVQRRSLVSRIGSLVCTEAMCTQDICSVHARNVLCAHQGSCARAAGLSWVHKGYFLWARRRSNVGMQQVSSLHTMDVLRARKRPFAGMHQVLAHKRSLLAADHVEQYFFATSLGVLSGGLTMSKNRCVCHASGCVCILEC